MQAGGTNEAYLITWLKRHAEGAIMVLFIVAVFAILATVDYFDVVEAASPAAPIAVEDCEHVATADSIKVFYCQDINTYVNQLGFMLLGE